MQGASGTASPIVMAQMSASCPVNVANDRGMMGNDGMMGECVKVGRFGQIIGLLKVCVWNSVDRYVCVCECLNIAPSPFLRDPVSNMDVKQFEKERQKKNNHNMSE